MPRLKHVHRYNDIVATWGGNNTHGATGRCRCGRVQDMGYKGDKILLGGPRTFAMSYDAPGTEHTHERGR